MCTECLGTDAERIAERALRATNEEDTAEGDALQATAEAAAVAAVEAAAMEDVVTADDPTTVVANNGHVAAVAEPVEEPLLALPSPPEPTPWLVKRGCGADVADSCCAFFFWNVQTVCFLA